MPVYEYEHIRRGCGIGRRFEVRQSMQERPLTRCPHCGKPVRKLISLVGVRTPRSDSELKDLGFTKLVKRDDGVYENVTARNGESRYMRCNHPETMPDLSKTIS